MLTADDNSDMDSTSSFTTGGRKKRKNLVEEQAKVMAAIQKRQKEDDDKKRKSNPQWALVDMLHKDMGGDSRQKVNGDERTNVFLETIIGRMAAVTKETQRKQRREDEEVVFKQLLDLDK